MRKILLSAAALLAFSVAAHADEKNLDFKLVNSTGYGIAKIYVDPTASDKWSDNILTSGVLENNEAADVTFQGDGGTCKWDLRVDWIDQGDPVYWRNLNLCEISTIELKYNRDTGETTAISQ